MNSETAYKSICLKVDCTLSHFNVDFERTGKKCVNGTDFSTFIFNDVHDNYRYTLSLFSDGKIALRIADYNLSSAECYESYTDNSKILTVTRFGNYNLECRIYNSDRTIYRILWSIPIAKHFTKIISEVEYA